jgi:glycosyltransferase involved in cell wall biosynthesis
VLIPPPYAPADTAAALLEVISHPVQAAEMRRRGRARAAEFNWAVTAQAMLAIFEEFGRC